MKSDLFLQIGKIQLQNPSNAAFYIRCPGRLVFNAEIRAQAIPVMDSEWFGHFLNFIAGLRVMSSLAIFPIPHKRPNVL